MPKITECRYMGRIVDIEEALALKRRDPDVVFRCTRCGERLRAHKRGTTGQAAHFEHRPGGPRWPLRG